MRLIDADALVAEIDHGKDKPEIYEGFEDTLWRDTCIDAAPAADPVHAAGGCYCRECEYHWSFPAHCDRFDMTTWDDDFCKFGDALQKEANDEVQA